MTSAAGSRRDWDSRPKGLSRTKRGRLASAVTDRRRAGTDRWPQGRGGRDAGADLVGMAELRRGLAKLGAEVMVIAPVGGTLTNGAEELVVDRTLLTTRSIEFDALLVASGTEPTDDIKLVILLQEAYRHCKALGAWGNGSAILESAGISLSGDGMVTGKTVGKAFTDQLVAAIGLHRAWARTEAVMASAVPPA